MVLILLHPWSSSSASPSDYGLAWLAKEVPSAELKNNLFMTSFFPVYCVLASSCSYSILLIIGWPMDVPISMCLAPRLPCMFWLKREKRKRCANFQPTSPNSSWLYDPACPTYCYSWAYLSYLPYLIVWLVTRNSYILSHLRKTTLFKLLTTFLSVWLDRPNSSK